MTLIGQKRKNNGHHKDILISLIFVRG